MNPGYPTQPGEAPEDDLLAAQEAAEIEYIESHVLNNPDAETPVKRPRGRPRKVIPPPQ